MCVLLQAAIQAPILFRLLSLLIAIVIFACSTTFAQNTAQANAPPEVYTYVTINGPSDQDVQQTESKPNSTKNEWQYGGFVDAAYLWDFNDPANHVFRSRGTAYRVNEPILNGIFPSLIGYDSLYARDNFSYTRPWGADFTPYLMMGANASYPVSKNLTVTGFIVNGYWHLADANAVPSLGGQIDFKPTNRITLKQTILIGPHQSNTVLEFWRFLSDSIVEWKTKRITTAFEYHVGEEKLATVGNPRALWMAAQLPVHWRFNPHWSITVRPEVYWDRNGRLTGFSQTVKANTTTLEFRVPYRQANAILRLEHRYDDSRGSGGGFFYEGALTPGVIGLKPSQHMLILGVILTFDSKFQH